MIFLTRFFSNARINLLPSEPLAWFGKRLKFWRHEIFVNLSSRQVPEQVIGISKHVNHSLRTGSARNGQVGRALNSGPEGPGSGLAWRNTAMYANGT